MHVLTASAVVSLLVCVALEAWGADAPPAEGPVAERFRELRHLYREDRTKAIEGFREFLKRYPDSSWTDDAQYWLALSLEKNKADRREVLAAYQTLLDKHPKSCYRDDALFAVAEVWFTRGRRAEDYQQAIKGYLKFIESCPKSKRLSEAKLKIGEIYYRRLRRNKEAALWFERVVKEHPKSSFVTRADRQLAEVYLRLERVDDALAIYTRLEKQELPDKEHITVRLGIVDCHLRRKDGLEKALTVCRDIRTEANDKKSLEEFAEYRTRNRMASFYHRRKKYKEAEAEYQAYVKRFGKSAGVWQARLNIGSIRLAAGKPAAAREMFQTITSKHDIKARNAPWYALRALYYEANTYEAEKKTPEAVKRYKLLVTHHGKSYHGRKARQRLEDIEKKAAEKAAKPKPK